MNQRGRLLSLFFMVMSFAGATFYLIWKVPLGLYISFGSIALAVVAMPFSIAPRAIEVALTTSFILAAGAFVAYIGFHDPLAAWFFLIAAVFSLPIVLFVSRYLRSASRQEEPQASEPQQQGLWQRLGWLFLKGLSLGLTAALLAITGYLGWHTWPQVSGNVLILATTLLIFLALLSIVIKRADKKVERWLSGEGLLALSSLLYELLLPLAFVLLLLNFVMK